MRRAHVLITRFIPSIAMLALLLLPNAAFAQIKLIQQPGALLPSLSQPNEVFVDSTTDGAQANTYRTITEALQAVADNGIVHVPAGTFAENLVLARPVQLLGPSSGLHAGLAPRANEAVINGTIAITAAQSVAINGFTLQQPVELNTNDGHQLLDDRFLPSGSDTIALSMGSGQGSVTMQGNFFGQPDATQPMFKTAIVRQGPLGALRLDSNIFQSNATALDIDNLSPDDTITNNVFNQNMTALRLQATGQTSGDYRLGASNHFLASGDDMYFDLSQLTDAFHLTVADQNTFENYQPSQFGCVATADGRLTVDGFAARQAPAIVGTTRGSVIAPTDCTAPSLDIGGDLIATIPTTPNVKVTPGGAPIASYRWTADDGMTISDPQTLQPTLSAKQAGKYHVQLAITDEHGLSASGQARFTWQVPAVGGPGGDLAQTLPLVALDQIDSTASVVAADPYYGLVQPSSALGQTLSNVRSRTGLSRTFTDNLAKSPAPQTGSQPATIAGIAWYYWPPSTVGALLLTWYMRYRWRLGRDELA